jgi:hypothetical protein
MTEAGIRGCKVIGLVFSITVIRRFARFYSIMIKIVLMSMGVKANSKLIRYFFVVVIYQKLRNF